MGVFTGQELLYIVKRAKELSQGANDRSHQRQLAKQAVHHMKGYSNKDPEMKKEAWLSTALLFAPALARAGGWLARKVAPMLVKKWGPRALSLLGKAPMAAGAQLAKLAPAPGTAGTIAKGRGWLAGLGKRMMTPAPGSIAGFGEYIPKQYRSEALGRGVAKGLGKVAPMAGMGLMVPEILGAGMGGGMPEFPQLAAAGAAPDMYEMPQFQYGGLQAPSYAPDIPPAMMAYLMGGAY